MDPGRMNLKDNLKIIELNKPPNTVPKSPKSPTQQQQRIPGELPHILDYSCDLIMHIFHPLLGVPALSAFYKPVSTAAARASYYIISWKIS
jgi:hypothetical protein